MKNETQIQLITKSDRNGIVPTVKWYRLAAEQGNAEALEDLDDLPLPADWTQKSEPFVITKKRL